MKNQDSKWTCRDPKETHRQLSDLGQGGGRLRHVMGGSLDRPGGPYLPNHLAVGSPPWADGAHDRRSLGGTTNYE